MYFWFPLLAGLSELTFDPRQDIRYSALEVPCRGLGIYNLLRLKVAALCAKTHPSVNQLSNQSINQLIIYQSINHSI